MARDLATATAPGPHPAGRDLPAVPNVNGKIGTVKIFGSDLQTIQRIGQDIERALWPTFGSAPAHR